MDSTIDPKLVEPTTLHSVDPRQTSLKHELVIFHKLASISPGMPRQKVPITFTYQKKGTTPPIYVAGSFSDPPWHPQEMDVSIDQRGCHRFTKQVLVNDGSEIQYKFRIGLGDWWALDDNADTVLDDCGNTNNILRVSISRPKEADTKASNALINELKGSSTNNDTPTPNVAKTAAEVADSARFIDLESPESDLSDGEAGRIGTRRMSHTPISQVSQTAIEVATVAAALDGNGSDSNEDIDGEDWSCPMFSHESIGPSNHGKKTSSDDGDDDNTDDHLENKSFVEFGDSAIEVEDTDFDNPNLEPFPSSNRESILAAVRRISTSIDADRKPVEGIPPSPVIPTFRQFEMVNSLDNPNVTLSSTDAPQDERQNLCPSSAIRQSSSSRTNVRAASMSSLGSIVEDDEPRSSKEGNKMEQLKLTNPFVQHPGPSWGSPEQAMIDDDNDEGIAMSIESRRRADKSEDSTHLADTPPTTSSDNASDMVSGSTQSVTIPGDDIDTSINKDNLQAATSNDVAKDDSTTPPRTMPGTYESDCSKIGGVSQGEAKSTSIDSGSREGLRKRTVDRPATPPSTNFFQGPKKPMDWLDACLQIVFVKWIGGLASWLYRRRHRALLAAGTAAIFVGFGVLWPNLIRL